MSAQQGDVAGFLSRWSRRKLEAGTAPETAAGPAPAAADACETGALRAPAADAEAKTLAVDLDSLDFESDFTRFMQAGIPDSLRTLALRRLWSASDIISQPDDLDDYLEDFSEAAMSLPPDLARSAWQVGRGFAAAEDAPEPPDRAPADRAEPHTEAAAAPAATRTAQRGSQAPARTAMQTGPDPEASAGSRQG